MYITLLILPLLATGCEGRKETAQTMPVPEISVTRPTVQNITLTKEYPGYLTSEKTVDLVGRVSGTLQTIAYAPGSRVRQGQVLFVIEPTVYHERRIEVCARIGSRDQVLNKRLFHHRFVL